MGNINQTRGQQVMPEPTTKVRVSAKDELDVWVMGEGDPVVFIHGAMARDFLKPLADELVRTGGYQAIHYGRRGHGGVGLPGETADIAGQATDVVMILDALGSTRHTSSDIPSAPASPWSWRHGYPIVFCRPPCSRPRLRRPMPCSRA